MSRFINYRVVWVDQIEVPDEMTNRDINNEVMVAIANTNIDPDFAEWGWEEIAELDNDE